MRCQGRSSHLDEIAFASNTVWKNSLSGFPPTKGGFCNPRKCPLGLKRLKTDYLACVSEDEALMPLREVRTGYRQCSPKYKRSLVDTWQSSCQGSVPLVTARTSKNSVSY